MPSKLILIQKKPLPLPVRTECQYTTFVTTQDYPRLGTAAAAIGSLTALTFSLPPVEVLFDGQVRLSADFSLNVNGAEGTGAVLINVLRDGESLTNGNQTFLRTDANVQSSYNLTLVDSKVTQGIHEYKVVLANTYPFPVTIDYYNITAQTPKAANSFYVADQAFGTPLEPVQIIEPESKLAIPLTPIRIAGCGQIKLTAFANLTSTLPVDALFEILANGRSLTNGPQTIWRELAVHDIRAPLVFNFTADVVDDKVVAENKYELHLINRSTAPLNLDYYSFSANVFENNCQVFFDNHQYPPLGETVVELAPRESKVFRLKPVVRKDTEALRLIANANITVPTFGDKELHFEIVRFSEDSKRGVGFSVTNGRQVIYQSPQHPGTEVGEIQSNLQQSITDFGIDKGKYLYELTLYNAGDALIAVDTLGFDAEL